MDINKKAVQSLSKYLAQAGIASRRKVVDIIKSGVVAVNDSVITEPGFKIVKQDEIRVNGKKIVASTHFVYILLNKPKNCISTVSDELNRFTVIDLVFAESEQQKGSDFQFELNVKNPDVRVYPIGRLDRKSTGLLVLTNDGNLTLKLSHPRYTIEKMYHVRLNKSFSMSDMQKLLSGVELEDGIVIVDEAYFIDKRSKKDVGVILHSGKNHVVRRLFAQLGYEVQKLDRVVYAGLTKKGLKVGQWRNLTSEEVAYLKQL